MQVEATRRSLEDDRLRFETLISDLSARFVKLPPSEVDQEIAHALQEVTEFFYAHRCGILEVLYEQNVARLTHAWYAEGVRRVPPGKSRTALTLVGDHRQASISTHHPRKNKQFARENIIHKFEEWDNVRRRHEPRILHRPH